MVQRAESQGRGVIPEWIGSSIGLRPMPRSFPSAASEPVRPFFEGSPIRFFREAPGIAEIVAVTHSRRRPGYRRCRLEPLRTLVLPALLHQLAILSAPVIAVPTSVGYGASFQGVAALLGMLNSSASNVTVMNIDNSLGAGYVASLINRL